MESCLKPRKSLIDGAQLRAGGERLDLAPEMARHAVDQQRFFRGAALARIGAARAKAAARWRLIRTGHISLQDDALALERRIGDRDHRRAGAGGVRASGSARR